MYEITKAVIEGVDYWMLYWNYFEMIQPIVYFSGIVIHILSSDNHDIESFIHVISCLLSLLKFLQLIRCFR